MPRSSLKQRALVVIGLAGLAAALSTSDASAFHFGGGGFGGFGGHAAMPHFGGGGFGGARPSFAHFGGGNGYHPRGPHVPGGQGGWPHPVGGRYPTGDRGPHQPHWPHEPREPHWPKVASHCSYDHDCGPHVPPHCIDHCGPRPPVGPHCGLWNHWCHPYPPIVHHCGPWNHWCQWPQPPIVVGGGGPVSPPSYGGTSGPSYSAPAAPVSAAPPIQPASTGAPKVCVPGGTYVPIVFQPNVTAAAITAFLKEYNVTMADGPTEDGVYRLRLSTETGSPDQFGEMIESMRGRTDIVASINS